MWARNSFAISTWYLSFDPSFEFYCLTHFIFPVWRKHCGPSVCRQPEGAGAEEVLLGVKVEGLLLSKCSVFSSIFPSPGYRYRHQLRSCPALSSKYHVILALCLCAELYLLGSFSSFLANIMLSWNLGFALSYIYRKLTRSTTRVEQTLCLRSYCLSI